MGPVRYPQFLKTPPSLFGFEVVDLFIIGITLNLLGQFGVSFIPSMLTVLSILGIRKVLKKYIDFTALLYGFNRPESFKWSEELEKLKESK